VPLDSNSRQGWYGEACVHVIAAAAGLVVSRPYPDYDGIDWNVAHPGPRGTKRAPKLDLQVKSCASPADNEGGESWSYRLKLAHFNQLAGRGFDVPRYLAFVITPDDADKYVTVTSEAITLAKTVY
jgi:hypothetical protein